MIDWLVSPAVSGAIGAIGGYFNKRLDLKFLDKRQTHELAMEESKRQTTIEVAKLDRDKTELVYEGEQRKREAMAFDRSQKTVHPWADIFKAVIRPIILIMVGYLCFQNMRAIDAMVGQANALNGDQLVELYTTVVLTLFSLFSMGVGWYFGERTSKITDAFMGILKR